jgi:hypothetical protein
MHVQVLAIHTCDSRIALATMRNVRPSLNMLNARLTDSNVLFRANASAIALIPLAPNELCSKASVCKWQNRADLIKRAKFSAPFSPAKQYEQDKWRAVGKTTKVLAIKKKPADCSEREVRKWKCEGDSVGVGHRTHTFGSQGLIEIQIDCFQGGLGSH